MGAGNDAVAARLARERREAQEREAKREAWQREQREAYARQQTERAFGGRR